MYEKLDKLRAEVERCKNKIEEDKARLKTAETKLREAEHTPDPKQEGRSSSGEDRVGQKMAQTLLFLEEHDLREYDRLENAAKEISNRFREISKRQKDQSREKSQR